MNETPNPQNLGTTHSQVAEVYARRFCVYIDTLCQGPVPVERGMNGYPVTYAIVEEAERSIAEDVIERLEQFLRGERDFDDAITVEEYVVPVDVTPEGVVIDTTGNVFDNNW